MLKLKMTKEGGVEEKMAENRSDGEGNGNLEMAEEGGNVENKEKNSKAIDEKEIPLINRVLPPEILEKVFSHLRAINDLNNVMLVCKTWKNIGEAPALWSGFTITRDSQLPSKRLQGCQEIFVGYDWKLNKRIGNKFTLGVVCQNVLERPAVKKITLANQGIWEHSHTLYGSREDWIRIEGDIITEAFAKVEELVIYGLFPQGSGLSIRARQEAAANQGVVAKWVVDAILDRPNHLKRLFLVNLSHRKGVDSLRLATALNKMQILMVKLWREEDVNLLFKTMVQSETSVTSLSLLGNLVLSELEPEYLFGVFDKLKELGIRAGDNPQNHPRQRATVRTLCEKIAAGTKLKTLRLQGFSDLSQVNRSTLSEMVTHLEELELSGRLTGQSFSRDDITTIVRGIATNETSNMKKLIIDTDLGSVDSRLFTQMAAKVVDLEVQSEVNELQAIAVFGAIAGQAGLGTLRLRKLTLVNCLYLQKLDADVAAIALNSLEYFHLPYHQGTFFTVDQTEKILRQAKKRTTLKKLSIWVLGYTRYKDHPLDPLITEAKKMIPDLDIWDI